MGAYLSLQFTLCWQHLSDHLENQVFRWLGASLCIQITSYTIYSPTGIKYEIVDVKQQGDFFGVF